MGSGVRAKIRPLTRFGKRNHRFGAIRTQIFPIQLRADFLRFRVSSSNLVSVCSLVERLAITSRYPSFVRSCPGTFRNAILAEMFLRTPWAENRHPKPRGQSGSPHARAGYPAPPEINLNGCVQPEVTPLTRFGKRHRRFGTESSHVRIQHSTKWTLLSSGWQQKGRP